jgi:hypothetical protein
LAGVAVGYFTDDRQSQAAAAWQLAGTPKTLKQVL